MHCAGSTGKASIVWGAWTDISGGAATASHRVTGLSAEEAGDYLFQIRPWTGQGAGTPSDIAKGDPAFVDANGLPYMDDGQIVEGGRTWRVGTLAVDIPSGMRLILGFAGLHSNGMVAVHLADAESDSGLTIDSSTGQSAGRRIAPVPHSAAAGPHRDLKALFDAILASIRVLP